MNFDIPRDQIVPIDSISVRLSKGRHPYELAFGPEIEANWQHEHAANPALFDGEMVLLSELKVQGRQITGLCHPVRYATMLHWRKNKGADGIEHSFAFPALVSSDNALVAVRMGLHTANPGMVYFAAGSFEPSDFVDGLVDLHGNMAREVREETGLDIDHVRRDANDHIFSKNYATAIFRRYWMDEDAETLAQRIEAHVAREAEPEIQGPMIIRAREPLLQDMSVHMAAIVGWHFAQG